MSQQALTIRKKVDPNAPELNREQRRRLERMVRHSRRARPKQYHLNKTEVFGQFAVKAENERQRKQAVSFSGLNVASATKPSK